MSTEKKEIYGVGAEFKSAAELFAAAEKVRDAGFKWWDVHSPFPIHGMDAAMGIGKSWVSAISLLGAATGLTTAICLQTLTSIEVPSFLKNIQAGWYLDLFYPMMVQNKPYWAVPAFVPIMFELTVLLTAFATVGGMLLFNLLPRLHHPLFNWDYFAKATDDGFFLVIEAEDPLYHDVETRKLLEEIGGTHITVIEK
jgi:hypothetical protein